MSETDFQRSIFEALEAVGVWVIRTGVKGKRSKRGFRTGEPGMPDLWTEYGWLEVKVPGKGLEPDQVAWHRKAERHGINVAMVCSPIQALDYVTHWRRQRALGRKGPP